MHAAAYYSNVKNHDSSCASAKRDDQSLQMSFQLPTLTLRVSTSFLSLWLSDCRSFMRRSAWPSWASSSASSSLLPSWNSSSSSWASWQLRGDQRDRRQASSRERKRSRVKTCWGKSSTVAPADFLSSYFTFSPED